MRPFVFGMQFFERWRGVVYVRVPRDNLFGSWVIRVFSGVWRRGEIGKG